MSKAAKFQLWSATVGLAAIDGKMRPVVIPEHAVIEIIDGAEDVHRMVEANWSGSTVMVFAQDILERGELLEWASSAA